MNPDLGDLSLGVGVVSGPEKVSARRNGAALVGLLEEAGRGHGAVGPQRLVVLVAETVEALERPHDERDGGQLRPGVRHLLLVETEGLQWGSHMTIYYAVLGLRMTLHNIIHNYNVPRLQKEKRACIANGGQHTSKFQA